MSYRTIFSFLVGLLLGLTATAHAEVDGDPFTGPEVEVCGPGVPMDGFYITSGGHGDYPPPFIEGHTLHLAVGYSCGCATHSFGGCWSGEFSISAPIETHLRVAHDNGGEGCELSCTSGIALDLTPISDVYRDLHGPGPGVVRINLDGWPEPLEYSFASPPVPVEATTWARVKAKFRPSP